MRHTGASYCSGRLLISSSRRTVGAPVSLPGLVARPWESVFNGQQRHGIAYRATAVAPGAFPMAQAG
ncbi:hypothetical protein AB5J72_26480 [Streptomyces sp. CG1]|uniref:hypothetical protein n=1 Tax=Streptomyces sp. CG1 TaxID=1287523 RepID=UPI0034E2042D